jgi:hypothetical protein
MFNKQAARASVARMLDWDMERVTVCHGNVLEQDCKSKLEQAFAFLGR